MKNKSLGPTNLYWQLLFLLCSSSPFSSSSPSSSSSSIVCVCCMCVCSVCEARGGHWMSSLFSFWDGVSLLLTLDLDSSRSAGQWGPIILIMSLPSVHPHVWLSGGWWGSLMPVCLALFNSPGNPPSLEIIKWMRTAAQAWLLILWQ